MSDYLSDLFAKIEKYVNNQAETYIGLPSEVLSPISDVENRLIAKRLQNLQNEQDVDFSIDEILPIIAQIEVSENEEHIEENEPPLLEELIIKDEVNSISENEVSSELSDLPIYEIETEAIEAIKEHVPTHDHESEYSDDGFEENDCLSSIPTRMPTAMPHSSHTRRYNDGSQLRRLCALIATARRNGDNTSAKELLIQIADKGEDDIYESKLRNKHLVVAMNELTGNEKLLEFALQVSDPKVINPISIVSVLPTSSFAERIIHKSRKNLEEIVKHFSGYETKLNTIATIDLNISSGISRVSKELFADVVMVNDSNKINLIKRIVGDDRAHLMDSCDKTIFFCQVERPSVNYEKIVVVAPIHAELEATFVSWVERIFRLSHELKIPIEAYMHLNTYERFLKVASANKIDATSKLVAIEEIQDFFIHANRKENDFVIAVGARTGSVSYFSDSDTFLAKVQKAYEDNDWVLVIPGQEKENLFKEYEDISGNAIGLGVDTLSRIGKEVGSIFKKQD